jgi:glycosyltransferase involved in cell wall biosynthesis
MTKAMDAEVSVIIPAYNYGHFLPDAIESVIDQTYRNFELIVVDDGSTDRTEQVCRRYGDVLKYIYQVNGGVSRAQNTGIEASKGEYIAFLGADDAWMPQKLELQVDFLESHKDIGMVFSNGYNCDEELGITGMIYENFDTSILDAATENLLVNNFIPGTSVMVRRRCLDSGGLFDEAIRGCEDWHLWIRISLGEKVGYIDQPLIKYRYHANNAHYDLDFRCINIFNVLEKVFNEPLLPRDISRKRKKIYAFHHLDIGHRYYSSYEMKKARKHLIQAIKMNPLQRSTYGIYLKSLMGKKMVFKLKRIITLLSSIIK